MAYASVLSPQYIAESEVAAVARTHDANMVSHLLRDLGALRAQLLVRLHHFQYSRAACEVGQSVYEDASASHRHASHKTAQLCGCAQRFLFTQVQA